MLAAKTVGYSTGPSGVYLAGLFERIGIGEAVKAKTRQVPSGMTVGPIIASGEAEIGFQQVSELAHVDGVDYIGPLPAEVQNITVFSAGIHTSAPHPDCSEGAGGVSHHVHRRKRDEEARPGNGLIHPSATFRQGLNCSHKKNLCWENVHENVHDNEACCGRSMRPVAVEYCSSRRNQGAGLGRGQGGGP